MMRSQPSGSSGPPAFIGRGNRCFIIAFTLTHGRHPSPSPATRHPPPATFAFTLHPSPFSLHPVVVAIQEACFLRVVKTLRASQADLLRLFSSNVVVEAELAESVTRLVESLPGVVGELRFKI